MTRRNRKPNWVMETEDVLPPPVSNMPEDQIVYPNQEVMPPKEEVPEHTTLTDKPLSLDDLDKWIDEQDARAKERS